MKQCCICQTECKEESEVVKCRGCQAYFCEKCAENYAFLQGVCSDCQEDVLLENESKHRHVVPRSERLW